jgi:cell division protein ZapA (FtsZ GTPase activity inhibitor)
MGKLHIEILGTSFTIQTNEDSEYLEKLLGYYKKITNDVSKINSINSSLQVSILSGLMICDELYKEKTNKLNNERNLNQKTQTLTSETTDDKEVEKRTLEMIEKIDKVL